MLIAIDLANIAEIEDFTLLTKVIVIKIDLIDYLITRIFVGIYKLKLRPNLSWVHKTSNAKVYFLINLLHSNYSLRNYSSSLFDFISCIYDNLIKIYINYMPFC